MVIIFVKNENSIQLKKEFKLGEKNQIQLQILKEKESIETHLR